MGLTTFLNPHTDPVLRELNLHGMSPVMLLVAFPVVTLRRKTEQKPIIKE